MTAETRLKELHIDNMLFNLLEDCYSLDFADVSSYFYQLTLQTFESEPNMIGPNRIPTGRSVVVDKNSNGRRSLNVVKKVDKPQNNPLSIWVVRGFYPNTGIPFKMVLWENDQPYTSGKYSSCKVTFGKHSSRKSRAIVNINNIASYVNEVAEKTLLDQPTNDIKKPENAYSSEFRCLTPKGLPKQANIKRKRDGKRRKFTKKNQ